MFYRVKFDGGVGQVLEGTGLFMNADQMIQWWPAGSTAKWIRWAKDRGLKPPDAAPIALSITALDKVERGSMSPRDGQRVLDSAYRFAMAQGSTSGIAAVRDLSERFAALSAPVADSTPPTSAYEDLGQRAWGIARDVVELVIAGRIDLTGDAASASEDAARIYRQRSTERGDLPADAARHRGLYLEALAYVAAWVDGLIQAGPGRSDWMASRDHFLDVLAEQLQTSFSMASADLADFERMLSARSQEYGQSLANSGFALASHLGDLPDPLGAAMATFAYVVSSVGECLKSTESTAK